jgi:hypothetical protein
MAGLADETIIPHSCTSSVLAVCFRVQRVLHSRDVFLNWFGNAHGHGDPTTYLLCVPTVWGKPESFVALHVLSVPSSRVSSMANAKRVFLNSVKPEKS